jgi:Catalytic LigB subunit of aromatic ring-opening dioxygenase
MAEIFFGFGSSHGPLLSSSPEHWDFRTAADRTNPAHPYRGKTYTFDQLLQLRKGEDLAALNRIEARRERHARCQHALDRLADRLATAAPDVIVLIGDDQHEWFKPELQPSFAVFHGETVLNSAFDEAEAKTVEPGRAEVMRDRHPPQDQHYPVDTALAHWIIDRLIADEFDVASLAHEPRNAAGPIGVGHAVQFIYRRILRDRPVPLVPIFLNTFYPPNQPTPKRCFDFGHAIGRAIASWDSDKRVAICASGGLSHFVIDEEFDHRIIAALETSDRAALLAEPNALFQSGTSETKNWITAAGILSQTKLRMKLLDYVPCYRSEAGTGNAMAFATWE